MILPDLLFAVSLVFFTVGMAGGIAFVILSYAWGDEA